MKKNKFLYILGIILILVVAAFLYQKDNSRGSQIINFNGHKFLFSKSEISKGMLNISGKEKSSLIMLTYLLPNFEPKTKENKKLFIPKRILKILISSSGENPISEKEFQEFLKIPKDLNTRLEALSRQYEIDKEPKKLDGGLLSFKGKNSDIITDLEKQHRVLIECNNPPKPPVCSQFLNIPDLHVTIFYDRENLKISNEIMSFVVNKLSQSYKGLKGVRVN